MSVNQNDLQRVIAEVLIAEPPVAGGGIDPWHAAEEVIDAFRFAGWTVVPSAGDSNPATLDEVLSFVKSDSGSGEDERLLVTRARDRAAEAARDAAECIIIGRTGDARSLLAEASRDLDTMERRAAQ